MSVKPTRTLRPEQRREVDDLHQLIKRAPETAKIHGMYVVMLDEVMKAHAVGDRIDEPLHRFRYYPLREIMQLELDCALAVYPTMSVHEGLRRLGQEVIPTFFDSILGKVLMGVAGRNWELFLRCLSRGYEISLKPGRATLTDFGRGRACVELRQVWHFGDSYQIGVVEGALDWCGLKGSITAHRLSDSDTDLVVEWQEN